MSTTSGPAPGAVVLAAGMLAACLVQMALGSLAPFLREAFSIGPRTLGGLGLLMFASAAAWAPISGWMTDRYGGRHQLVLLLAFTVASWLLIAIATDPSALAAAVILGGLALAASNPATNQLIAVHARPETRARLVSAKQAGAQSAGFFAGALPVAAGRWGLRGIGVALALASLGLAATSLRRLPPPRPIGTTRRSSRAWRAEVVDALIDSADRSTARRQRRMIGALAVYAGLMGAGVGATVSFLPITVLDRTGLPLDAAGAVVAVLSLAGTAAIFGWVRLVRRGTRPSRVLTAMALIASGSTLAILASGDGRGPVLWLAVAGVGISYSTWLVIVMAIVVGDEGRVGLGSNPGRVSGRILMAFFIGMAAGPVGFAELTVRLGSGTALAGLAGLFVAGASVTVGRDFQAEVSDR